MPQHHRQRYDRATKDHVVELVRKNAASIPEICKEYAVQPYQVYAWVGERTLAKQPSGNSSEVIGIHVAPRETDTLDAVDEDLAKRVGIWWLKHHMR